MTPAWNRLTACSIRRLVPSNIRGLWLRYLSLSVLGVLAVTAVATSRSLVERVLVILGAVSVFVIVRSLVP